MAPSPTAGNASLVHLYVGTGTITQKTLRPLSDAGIPLTHLPPWAGAPGPAPRARALRARLLLLVVSSSSPSLGWSCLLQKRLLEDNSRPCITVWRVCVRLGDGQSANSGLCHLCQAAERPSSPPEGKTSLKRRWWGERFPLKQMSTSEFSAKANQKRV